MSATELTEQRELLRLATAGSVDDGKSTLIGRLLLDTGSLMTDHPTMSRVMARSPTSRPLPTA